jgi:hypothetical protein
LGRSGGCAGIGWLLSPSAGLPWLSHATHKCLFKLEHFGKHKRSISSYVWSKPISVVPLVMKSAKAVSAEMSVM